MEDDIQDTFFEAFENFGALGPFIGGDFPESPSDLLTFTVGEYLDLLDLVEQNLDASKSQLQPFLNNPAFTSELDAE